MLILNAKTPVLRRTPAMLVLDGVLIRQVAKENDILIEVAPAPFSFNVTVEPGLSSPLRTEQTDQNGRT